MVVDLKTYSSPQIKLVCEIDRSAEERDMGTLSKVFHKDFCHVTLPQSLGVPPVNRDTFIAAMTGHFAGDTPLHIVKFINHSVVEAPGLVAIHRTSIVKKGPTGVEETDESFLTLEFASDEEGNLQVKGMQQFTDVTNRFPVYPDKGN